MIRLAPDIKNALHAGSRAEKYLFEIVNRYGIKKETEIEVLETPTISVNSKDEVKRRGEFTFKKNPLVDYLNDRIQPVIAIQLYDGSWERFKKGRYMMIDPSEKYSDGQMIVAASCMDESVILQQDYYYEKAVFTEGTKYTAIFNSILISAGFTRMNITENSNTIPADIVLDDSKHKLAWINELAAQINYRDIYFDDYGIPNMVPFFVPDASDIDYTYRDDEYSVITPEMEIKTDFWNVPNIIKRTVSRPDLEPLTATWINNNPGNKFSLPARGIRIVDSETVDMVASQTELNNLVDRLGFEAQQTYQEIMINTLNMPHHGIYDVIELRRDEAGGIYTETEWTLNLAAGEQMQHTLKRLII